MLQLNTSSGGYRAAPDREQVDTCIAGVAAKNQEDFATLYRLTAPSVYSYALSVLKNSYDAEDVLHDCFVRIYQAAGSYRSVGKPMAWILTVAKNLCMQKLRDTSTMADIPEEDWQRSLSENTHLSVDEKLLIHQCMSLLSEEERQIVTLHAVAGFKHREIAEHMDLLLPTVLSKYNRAIKKLKSALEKESDLL